MRLVAFMLIGLAFAGCLGGDGDDLVDLIEEHGEDLQNHLENETIPEIPETPTPAPVEPTPEPVKEVPAYKPPHYPNDGSSEKTITTVTSFDGYEIPVTIYKPTIANAETQVPVLLQSHGFTGEKETDDDAFLDHIAAGFGVVSYDQRGHGDAKSTSSVSFMHPDAEVKDVVVLIDEIASWDWVLKEPDNATDPVLGTFGYSYGGAMQLMGSIFDDRIDALVPEITWSHITDALAPGGAINSGWVDLFYLAGNAQQSVTFNDDFHAGWIWATTTNQLPAGQAPGVPDLVTGFDLASPKFYPEKMDKPTLLVQGMSDTLFPLNQAVANYETFQSNGAPVRLYTHLGGHVLNTASLAPGTLPVEVGLQGIPGDRPCGDMTPLQIAWHQTYLLQLEVDLGPEVCFSLEDGSAITGDAWPIHDVNEAIPLDLPAIVTAPAGAPNLYDLGVAPGTVIAGIPKINGTITAPSADTIVYFSLQILRSDGLFEHIVNDQVRPLRLNTPGNVDVPFEVEMHGVGLQLQDGETLYLSISNVEPMYVANSNRVPSAAILQNLELTLPIVSDPRFVE